MLQQLTLVTTVLLINYVKQALIYKSLKIQKFLTTHIKNKSHLIGFHWCFPIQKKKKKCEFLHICSQGYFPFCLPYNYIFVLSQNCQT